MTEMLIFLSKYLFIVLLLIFGMQSWYLISKGRNMDYPSAKSTSAVKLQRVTIVLFHILAFATLNFNSEIPIQDYLTVALGGLLLILVMPWLIGLVYGKINGLAVNCMFFLMDISLVTLQRLNPSFAIKQLIFFAIGSVCILVIYPILKHTKELWRFKYVYLGLSFALLLVTLILGTTTRGATNWIYIGSFSFQPAEIVKILYVFYFASVFCHHMTFRETIIQMLIGAVFVVLLVFQRDLGSALIFFMTLLIMVFISTGNIIAVGGSLLAAGFGSVIAYHLFSHIRVRVTAWLDPWSDISNTTYQIAQSLFAIGSGGLWGSGLGKGYASSIPIVETDFIFSAICEEFGIVFAVLMIFIYITLFYCGVRSALNTDSKFNALISSGLTGLLCFQTFLIIGGVTKFIPMTGVTLPFVSYGGTSVVISTILVGLLLFYYVPKSEDSEIKYGPDDIRRKRRRRRPSEEPRRTRGTTERSASGKTSSLKKGQEAAAASRPLKNVVRGRKYDE